MVKEKEEKEEEKTAACTSFNEKLEAAAEVATAVVEGAINSDDANNNNNPKSIPKENDCAAMIAAEAMSALFAGRVGGGHDKSAGNTDDGDIAKVEAKDQLNYSISSEKKDTSSAPSTPSRKKKKGLSYASTNSPSRQTKKLKTGNESADGSAAAPHKGRGIVRGSGRAGPKNATVAQQNAAHPIPPYSGHYQWTGAGNPYYPHHHYHAGHAHPHAHAGAYSQYPPPPPSADHYANSPPADSDRTSAPAPAPAAAASYPYSYSYYYPPHGGVPPDSAPDQPPAPSDAASKTDVKATGDASQGKVQEAPDSRQAAHYQQQYPSHAYYYPSHSHHAHSYAHHQHYSSAAAHAQHHHYHQQQWSSSASAQPPRRG